MTNHSLGGEGNAGSTLSKEVKDKISKGNTGKVRSKEVREKYRLRMLGKPNVNKGKVLTKETKDKMSKNSSKYKLLQYGLEGNFIKEWNNANIAARELNIKSSICIRCCAHGKYKVSGGYQWKIFTENYPFKIEKYVKKELKF